MPYFIRSFIMQQTMCIMQPGMHKVLTPSFINFWTFCPYFFSMKSFSLFTFTSFIFTHKFFVKMKYENKNKQTNKTSLLSAFFFFFSWKQQNNKQPQSHAKLILCTIQAEYESLLSAFLLSLIKKLEVSLKLREGRNMNSNL